MRFDDAAATGSISREKPTGGALPASSASAEEDAHREEVEQAQWLFGTVPVP